MGRWNLNLLETCNSSEGVRHVICVGVPNVSGVYGTVDTGDRIM
jgi:hypothetical protein